MLRGDLRFKKLKENIYEVYSGGSQKWDSRGEAV